MALPKKYQLSLEDLEEDEELQEEPESKNSASSPSLSSSSNETSSTFEPTSSHNEDDEEEGWGFQPVEDDDGEGMDYESMLIQQQVNDEDDPDLGGLDIDEEESSVAKDEDTDEDIEEEDDPEVESLDVDSDESDGSSSSGKLKGLLSKVSRPKKNNSSSAKQPNNNGSSPSKIRQKLENVSKSIIAFILGILDKCGVIFNYLKKIPVVGKIFTPIKAGTVLARWIIGVLLALVLLIIPFLISSLFYQAEFNTISGAMPDNGKVVATSYKVGDDKKTLTVDVANKGDVIASDVQPKIEVSAKHLYNPISWFSRTKEATCTTDKFSSLNIDESRSIALTCDAPIGGYSHEYSGSFVDIS